MVSPGITDELTPCFVAWDPGEGSAHPDPQEDLSVRRPPFRDAIGVCLSGAICGAPSVATILAVYIRAPREKLPEDLLWRLR